MNEIKVYVDGACFPNPGKGGWGWTTLLGESDCGGLDYTTNNIMELLAPIKAIKSLWKPDKKLIIYSDSQYVVKGINEWIHNWIKNDWMKSKNSTKKIMNKEIWQELHCLVKDKCVTFEWVKGHSGHPGNDEADRLSKLGSKVSPELILQCERRYEIQKNLP